MKDKFDACELAGRSIVRGIIEGMSGKVEETASKFDSIDIFATAVTGDIGAVEVKLRSGYTSYDIDDMGGHILEFTKWKALMDAWENSGYTPTYWMAYSDRVCLVWDLRDIKNPKFETRRYPSTTAVKGNDTDKRVTYLKREDAKREYRY